MRVEVFTSSSQFGLRVGSLYRAFDTGSELCTFTLRAESVEDAIQKARSKYYRGECCWGAPFFVSMREDNIRFASQNLCIRLFPYHQIKNNILRIVNPYIGLNEPSSDSRTTSSDWRINHQIERTNQAIERIVIRLFLESSDWVSYQTNREPHHQIGGGNQSICIVIIRFSTRCIRLCFQSLDEAIKSSDSRYRLNKSPSVQSESAISTIRIR